MRIWDASAVSNMGSKAPPTMDRIVGVVASLEPAKGMITSVIGKPSVASRDPPVIGTPGEVVESSEADMAWRWEGDRGVEVSGGCGV